jgi:hypothetical protein
LASAFLKKVKYNELATRYRIVMVRKGVKKSLPVIIAPEIVALVALGSWSDMTIRPFVVARSSAFTDSI